MISASTLRFLRKAIHQNGLPAKITIDKSGASAAAVNSYNADADANIELRQVKYLNNIVEEEHRAVKRLTRPMLGFKSFWSAAKILAGIELMHMIRKGQMIVCAAGGHDPGRAVPFTGSMTSACSRRCCSFQPRLCDKTTTEE